MNMLGKEQNSNSRLSLGVKSIRCSVLTGRNRNLAFLTFLHSSLLDNSLRAAAYCDCSRRDPIQISEKLCIDSRWGGTNKVKREKHTARTWSQ
jgi:hypothetical protein